eukprot:scaffold10794_cov119-Isochrysis_galbana.AAC.3
MALPADVRVASHHLTPAHWAVGAGWLKSEPEREQAVRSAAKLFVSPEEFADRWTEEASDSQAHLVKLATIGHLVLCRKNGEGRYLIPRRLCSHDQHHVGGHRCRSFSTWATIHHGGHVARASPLSSHQNCLRQPWSLSLPAKKIFCGVSRYLETPCVCGWLAKNKKIRVKKTQCMAHGTPGVRNSRRAKSLFS